jgi:hypothetical protein
MSNLIVRVVNVRHLPGPLPAFQQEWPFIYVGRACISRLAVFKRSSLANPFKLPRNASESDRILCLDQYKGWLDANPRRGQWVEHLLGLVLARGKPLGCWCADWDGVSEPAPLCHAVVLAKLLMQKHRGKGVCS